MYLDPASNIRSFQGYCQFYRSWCVVKPSGAGYLTCSCQQGMKFYQCGHSLAVEIRENLVQLPARFHTVPLADVRRGRGRPKSNIKGGYGSGGKAAAKK